MAPLLSPQTSSPFLTFHDDDTLTLLKDELSVHDSDADTTEDDGESSHYDSDGEEKDKRVMDSEEFTVTVKRFDEPTNDLRDTLVQARRALHSTEPIDQPFSIVGPVRINMANSAVVHGTEKNTDNITVDTDSASPQGIAFLFSWGHHVSALASP